MTQVPFPPASAYDRCPAVAPSDKARRNTVPPIASILQPTLIEVNEMSVRTTSMHQCGSRRIHRKSKAVSSSLQVIRVAPRTIPLNHASFLIPQGHITKQKPAILAICRPYARLSLERFSRSQTRAPLLHGSSRILRMKGSAPAQPCTSSSLNPINSSHHRLTTSNEPSGLALMIRQEMVFDHKPKTVLDRFWTWDSFISDEETP